MACICGPEERQRYKIAEKLGSGEFGNVYACRDRRNPHIHPLACKIIPLDYYFGIFEPEQGMDLEDVMHVEVVKHLSESYPGGHPNIVNIKCAFHDYKRVYFVMERYNDGRTLSDLLSIGYMVPEVKIQMMITSLMNGINACHAVGVIHGNVNPGNILLSDDEMEVKLCGFFLSSFFNSEPSGLDEMYGRDAYIAPELGESPRGPEMDLWCVGVILYAMLGGNTRDLYPYPTELHLSGGPWHSVSAAAKSVLRSLLAKDPKRRMTTVQFFEHAWFRRCSP